MMRDRADNGKGGKLRGNSGCLAAVYMMAPLDPDGVGGHDKTVCKRIFG